MALSAPNCNRHTLIRTCNETNRHMEVVCGCRVARSQLTVAAVLRVGELRLRKIGAVRRPDTIDPVLCHLGTVYCRDRAAPEQLRGLKRHGPVHRHARGATDPLRQRPVLLYASGVRLNQLCTANWSWKILLVDTTKMWTTWTDSSRG